MFDPENKGLTNPERFVLVHLGNAWNEWITLPDKHPDDDAEFRAAVHALQNLIAFRVARRVNPRDWWPSR